MDGGEPLGELGCARSTASRSNWLELEGPFAWRRGADGHAPGGGVPVGPEDGGRNGGPPAPGAVARPALGERGGSGESLRNSQRLRDAEARHFRADCNDADARHEVQLRSGSSLLGLLCWRQGAGSWRSRAAVRRRKGNDAEA